MLLKSELLENLLFKCHLHSHHLYCNNPLACRGTGSAAAAGPNQTRAGAGVQEALEVSLQPVLPRDSGLLCPQSLSFCLCSTASCILPWQQTLVYQRSCCIIHFFIRFSEVFCHLTKKLSTFNFLYISITVYRTNVPEETLSQNGDG